MFPKSLPRILSNLFVAILKRIKQTGSKLMVAIRAVEIYIFLYKIQIHNNNCRKWRIIRTAVHCKCTYINQPTTQVRVVWQSMQQQYELEIKYHRMRFNNLRNKYQALYTRFAGWGRFYFTIYRPELSAEAYAFICWNTEIIITTWSCTNAFGLRVQRGIEILCAVLERRWVDVAINQLTNGQIRAVLKPAKMLLFFVSVLRDDGFKFHR